MLKAKVNWSKLNGKTLKMTHHIRCGNFAPSLKADVFMSV